VTDARVVLTVRCGRRKHAVATVVGTTAGPALHVPATARAHLRAAGADLATAYRASTPLHQMLREIGGASRIAWCGGCGLAYRIDCAAAERAVATRQRTIVIDPA
jgi:hypothetical protein